MKAIFYASLLSGLMLSGNGWAAGQSYEQTECYTIDSEKECEENNGQVRLHRYPQVPNYNQSYVHDPVDNERMTYPSHHESSFYDLMTK